MKCQVVLGMLLVALSLLACDTSLLISSLTATPTPTRTPRPTFTPRPEFSPTPAQTATPTATNTPAATATRTRAAVVATARPTTPAPPPPPQFPVRLSEYYDCPQSSESGVYEIVGRIQRPVSPPFFLGDYVIEVRSPDGSFRKTAVSLHNEAAVTTNFQTATDCRAANFWSYNFKMDVSEKRGTGPFLVRIVKSTTDSTPLSAEATVDFKQSVRWIFYYFAQ